MDGTDIHTLRQLLRERVNDGLFKEASLGGSQEAGFEQAFSSLAYAYLKDKAPRLLDSLVGFQLVDRNEDNTKAMAVFGFQIGKQWLYAPVFFLNGDLKGHELLYVKKSDSFIPMKENWVNYILSRKPHVLGEASEKETPELGGLVADISTLRNPPTSAKYGSDRFSPRIANWSKPFLPLVAAAKVKSDSLFREKHAELGQRLSLEEFLSQDISLAKGAFEIIKKYPGLKRSCDRFYGPDFFSTVAKGLKKSAGHLIPKTLPKRRSLKKLGRFLISEETSRPIEDPLKTGALRVFIYDHVSINYDADELDDEERERLLRDGTLIQDHREGDQVSVAYNTQTESKLSNPHETGLYMVLERPSTFNKMLVITNPHSNNGRENFATVIRLGDGEKAWMNAHRTNVWANDIDSGENYREWFDGLSESNSLDKGAIYVALDNQGSGTVPFTVRESYDDGSYKVDMKDHMDWGHRRSGSLPPLDQEEYGSSERYSSWDALLHINARKGSQLRSISGELHVPDNFKFIRLRKSPKPSDSGSNIMCCHDDDTGSDPKPISPGNLSDIQMLFTEKTSRMKIYNDHDEIVISTDHKGHQRMTKKAGVISLVKEYGMREQAAREMIKQAERKGARIFRVKYAQPYDPSMMLQPGPGAPAIPPPSVGSEPIGYGSVPTIYPQETGIPVQGLQAGMTDPSIYDPFSRPDPKSMQVAQQAGQTGQKEVFDTAMISSMLKAVRQDSLVDRYLGDLLNALDKLGRILFMFYWHGEEFEDRYGKQDLPEIEDSLRNAFEVLGDVVLFLKEKAIEPGLEELGEPNLEEAARN